jgi:TRAP-type transport system periplasmic protein
MGAGRRSGGEGRGGPIGAGEVESHVAHSTEEVNEPRQTSLSAIWKEASMSRSGRGGMDRRHFLKTLGLGVGAAAFGARRASAAAAGKVARIGYIMAPGGAADKSANDLAKYVAEKSKGELTIQTFPGAQLGGERDMVESVQLGSIEIGYFGSYVIANVAPEWGLIMESPYTIRSQEHFRKVVDGPLAKPIYDALLQRKGIRHIAWALRGPRYLTSNKPIKTPADLKGVKIRVPEVETSMVAWKLLGATVTPMAFAEIFMALKQGTIDAQENPYELIYTSSFYEVQKYLNLTAHLRSGYEIVVSERWFKTLSPALQQIVTEGLLEMAKAEDRYQAVEEADLEKKLKEKGMIFNPVDLPKFEEALKDLPKAFAGRWAPGFYEAVKAIK